MEASTLPLKTVDPAAEPEANWRVFNEDMNLLTELISELQRRLSALELEVEQLDSATLSVDDDVAAD